MAIVENQLVEVKWNGRNKQYYESFVKENGEMKYGKYTHKGTVNVEPSDLPSQSSAMVKFTCDYCNEEFFRSWIKYNRIKICNQKYKFTKDVCLKCDHIKRREIFGNPNEENYDSKNEEPIETRKYTEEDLTTFFYKYKDEFGTYPKKIDFEGNSDYPSASAYTLRWGNWSNFIKSLNITSEDGWYKDDELVLVKYYETSLTPKEINDNLMVKRSIHQIQLKAKKLGLIENQFHLVKSYDISNKEKRLESSLKSIIDLFEYIGNFPTVSEYDKHAKENGLYYRRNLIDILNKNFSVICSEVIGGNNKDIKDKSMLLQELIKLKEKLGRTPKANELKKYGLSEKKAYIRKFNMRYQDIIESLGWELSTPKLNIKSDDELLDDYLLLYKDLGRIPNSKDLSSSSHIAHSQTYINRFGSMKNVWDILDIEYCPSQNISSGFVFINSNNEICRSTPEFDISNLFIRNKIVYTPEVRYSKIFTCINNKWIMDWYLNDYHVCVEYFGLYSENNLERNTRLGKYSRKVKRKIKECESNNIKLISLYSEDLKNNFEGMLYKFSNVGIQLTV